MKADTEAKLTLARIALTSYLGTKVLLAMVVITFVMMVASSLEAGGIPKLPGKRGTTFMEKDGLVVMEVEHVYDSSHWKKENKMEGFTGTCYFTWRGRNYLNRPGKGKLRFRFIIKNPGTYHLRIRNRHDYKDSTEQNK